MTPLTAVAKLKAKNGRETFLAFGEKQGALTESWDLFVGESVQRSQPNSQTIWRQP